MFREQDEFEARKFQTWYTSAQVRSSLVFRYYWYKASLIQYFDSSALSKAIQSDGSVGPA